MVEALYKLSQIRQCYEGRTVLSIDRLILPDKGIIGFFGPNGSGKSTLLSLLALISRPAAGDLFFRGQRSSTLEPEQRRRITMLPQEPYLLKRTVFENVAYGLKIRAQREHLEPRVVEALALVGLPATFGHRKWYQLSGGEAQRVALAARLALRPEVLILDEPTASVDGEAAQLIREAVLQAREKWRTTLLVASHDHAWLDQICDHRVALFQGQIVPGETMNLLFGPWIDQGTGRFVKIFPDGQQLVLSGAQDAGGENGVAMIEPQQIALRPVQQERQGNKDAGLNGVVAAVHRQRNRHRLVVDVMVGGLLLRADLSAREVQKFQLWPGTRVRLHCAPRAIRWLR